MEASSAFLACGRLYCLHIRRRPIHVLGLNFTSLAELQSSVPIRSPYRRRLKYNGAHTALQWLVFLLWRNKSNAGQNYFNTFLVSCKSTCPQRSIMWLAICTSHKAPRVPWTFEKCLNGAEMLKSAHTWGTNVKVVPYFEVILWLGMEVISYVLDKKEEDLQNEL